MKSIRIKTCLIKLHLKKLLNVAIKALLVEFYKLQINRVYCSQNAIPNVQKNV